MLVDELAGLLPPRSATPAARNFDDDTSLRHIRRHTHAVERDEPGEQVWPLTLAGI